MALNAHIPPPLRRGGTIALAATARSVSPELVENVIIGLEAMGYNVLRANNLNQTFGIFAGTDSQRAAALQDLLDSADVQAIICMRGGYGTTRILNSLSFSGLRQHPKWILGFSDTTLLINYIAKLGLTTLHGPMGLHFGEPDYATSWEAAFALMTHRFERYNELMRECTFQMLQVLENNVIRGKAIAGNLSLLAHSTGTPYMPDYQDAILFIEDIDEYLYHIDRMFWQLAHAGALSSLAGVCIGQFTDLKDNPEPFVPQFPELLIEHATRHNLPIVAAPIFGHQAPNMPIVAGGRYRISRKGLEWMPSDS